MANGYEGIEKLIGYVTGYAALAFGASFLIYHFTVDVLPWLILGGVVIALIIFGLWYRSKTRVRHPWE